MLFLLDDRTVAVAPHVGEAEETLLSRQGQGNIVQGLTLALVWGLSCLCGNLVPILLKDEGIDANEAFFAPVLGTAIVAAIAIMIAATANPEGPVLTTAKHSQPPRLRWQYRVMTPLTAILPLVALVVMIYNITITTSALAALIIVALAAAQIAIGVCAGYAAPYFVWKMMHRLTKQVHLDGKAILRAQRWSDELPAYPMSDPESFVQEYNQTCRANAVAADAMDTALIAYVTEAQEVLGYIAMGASESIGRQAKSELARLRDATKEQVADYINQHLSAVHNQQIEEARLIKEQDDFLAEQRSVAPDKMLSEWLSKKGANYQRS